MKKTLTLKTYFYALLIEGLISLFWLLLIPGDPKSAVLLGMSKFRLLLFFVLLLSLGLVAIITYKIHKNKAWYQNIINKIDETFAHDGHLTTAFMLALAGFLGGSYFLYTTFTTSDLFLLGYFSRLAPLMFWFTALCIQTILYLFHKKEVRREYLQSHAFAILILLLILISGMLMHTHLWYLQPEEWDARKIFTWDDKFELEEQDIFAIFNEGDHLQHGTNPYLRALETDGTIEWNQIFATYLPISYVLAWLTQEIGLEDFIQWLSLWRVIFLIANLGITFLLFYISYHRYNNLIYGVIAAIFWLFNRWTLHMTMIYHIDFIAIFFLLLSLILWSKYKVISLLAFGLSLGVKHIAMFMIPLYMIWIWQATGKRAIKQFILLNLVMASIPLLVSAPFLISNAAAFFKSIFVSATRISESHFGAPAVDTLLMLSGIPAKLPMLALMFFTFWAAWKKKIKIYAAALIIILVFVDFNSVLFRQYMTWVSPLTLLAICETMIPPPKQNARSSSSA